MALSVGISITLLACIGELAASSGLLGIGNILLLVQRSRPRGSISPKSAVDYNGSVYIKDNYHWASSSSQISACSFEPGTIEDLGKAVRVAEIKISDQIVNLIPQLKILGDTRTPFARSTRFWWAVIWDDVYSALEEYGVNVVGAVTTIASSNDPDLFFGLRIVEVLNSHATVKGSLNNFGIVTHVTLKTYPQSQFWHRDNYKQGGRISCSEDQLSAANTVIAAFTANHITISLDAVVFNSIAIEEWTKSLLNDIANETLLYSAKLANASASIASYAVDPYLDSIYNHVDTPSAYPDSRRRGYSFLELYYAWINPNNDDLVYDTVATSSNHMEQVAITTGQDVGNVVVYPNEASPSTPLEDIYGENLARLQDIKKAVDPDNVMGLAGGWKL
ncbi:hypothetical protein DFH29DRAFT_881405 [Suillus ampliporus]|nr:hypothetical protein DFH29DRAFT_881405 [Suillus ampliporus]